MTRKWITFEGPHGIADMEKVTSSVGLQSLQRGIYKEIGWSYMWDYTEFLLVEHTGLSIYPIDALILAGCWLCWDKHTTYNENSELI